MMNIASPRPSHTDLSIKKDIRSLLFNARWSLKLSWSTHRSLTLGLVGSSVIRSMMPAGLALTARGLIDVVVRVLAQDTGQFAAILPWLLLGCGLTIAQAVSNLASNFFSRRLSHELDLRITTDILTHAAGLDLSLFEDPRFQDMMERAQQNTAVHFSRFLNNTLATLTNSFQVATLFAILFFIEPIVVPILFPVALPYFVFQWRLAKRGYLKENERTTKRRWKRYFVTRLTSAKSVAEVKLLELAPLFTHQLRSLLNEFRDQDRRIYTRSFFGSSLFAFLSTIVFYLVFARVAMRALEGELSVGDVAVFGGAASGLRYTLEHTVLCFSRALEKALYISNIIEFLSLRPRLANSEGVTPSTGRGEIQLENVAFTYPGSSQEVLADVSLHIRPGETVGIFGKNGAGKSTLVKLIARLYDPDNGRILFEGKDLRDLSLDYFHREISFVFQNFGRYEATVADNIAYGDWRRMIHDRSEVESAARIANVHDMIEAMPQKFDTMVGRMFGEYDLSGGQWQRIAVARAFARKASLLILDEPTSTLDAKVEYELFSRFRQLAEGRTIILISHRFSTVRMADRIVVMDKGRIVECGTHQELLAKAGHYASLFQLQQRQTGIFAVNR